MIQSRLRMPLDERVAIYETEISDQQKLVDKPLVTILMLAYNHAAYLKEAIDGVMSQECDFAFELIIGEDFSTDNTREIVLDYQVRFPDRIRIIYSDHNVGATRNVYRILARARGSFIACCEGDDYWCYKKKLAEQVALICSDKCIGVVHSNWVRSKSQRGIWTIDWNKTVHSRTHRSLLEGALFATFHYPKILRTCTVMYRGSALIDALTSPLATPQYPFLDTVIAAHITSRWRVAYLPKVTAVYRVSPNSALRSGWHSTRDFLKSCLAFDTEARNYFADRNDYPPGYRWERSVGLLLKAIRICDFQTAQFAVADIWHNFTVWQFILTGFKSLRMRLPAGKVFKK